MTMQKAKRLSESPGVNLNECVGILLGEDLTVYAETCILIDNGKIFLDGFESRDVQVPCMSGLTVNALPGTRLVNVNGCLAAVLDDGGTNLVKTTLTEIHSNHE